MYIETSRPRKEGDQARLISPFFNVAPKNPYGITNPPAYCFGFFYHMYGKHIGKNDCLHLKPLLNFLNDSTVYHCSPFLLDKAAKPALSGFQVALAVLCCIKELLSYSRGTKHSQ